MKVLMVTNIYPTEAYPGRGSFVKGQVDSIQKEGVDVEVEYVNAIDGRAAFFRSASHIFRRSFLKEFDLIHAHYGTTGIISRLQWKKPVVVSYLGSDLLGNPKQDGYGKTIDSQIVASLCRLNSLAVHAVIVKSREMRRKIPKKQNVFVIPNGVDFDLFRPMDSSKARKMLGIDPKKRYVLFPSNAMWPRKGYPLAEKAVRLLQEQGMPVELMTVYAKSQDVIPLCMNACDVMIMTSLWEGSPNVVKESMACNLPVLSVDVGDVSEVIGGCGGCFMVERNTAAVALKLREMLEMPIRTRGRDHIRHLEMQRVAKRIVHVYKQILQHASVK